MQNRQDIRKATRRQLIEWLEGYRGMACYAHESTSLLRKAALEDWSAYLSEQRS